MPNQRIHLLGANLDALSMQETLAKIEELIRLGKPSQHISINAGKINLMVRNPRLAEIINAAPLVSADGQSVVLAARYLGRHLPERVAGIDLFQELVKLSAEKGWKPYYFGAEEEVVERVVKLDQERYPELEIAGYRNGYFEEAESEQIAKEIRESGADILFVAFSSPKKEFWIHEYQETLQVPFMMGVGGSFDVLSGKTKRAPAWMQKAGLEWFYRFQQEPRRLFSRYIIGNLEFLFRVWREKRKEDKQ
ncbi:beta-1,4-N-acetyl-mannosaminyltransferase [Listeria floridensis FSL S10-1187]|uniref:Beta-1,4-N-acetyl-mannosaminyltransferase n=1 Tax=Listeria floridensis FSL S10-1187 TaxID=1265817 RepID=A0ABN0REP1_9LIST|nr:WecB/TagA/CpsF family glycosyltransferase [Listeria floridensis]EUJ31345.1 beta-1,4-N-acetyl-mannosaminyltransferase [Listeria floridensis FSL S10-1187]